MAHIDFAARMIDVDVVVLSTVHSFQELKAGAVHRLQAVEDTFRSTVVLQGSGGLAEEERLRYAVSPEHART